MTLINVLITLLSKSHNPPSRTEVVKYPWCHSVSFLSEHGLWLELHSNSGPRIEHIRLGAQGIGFRV